MPEKFDYFVVLAEMRTGSNFLEANLNEFPDLECLGEAFNPHFIGYPNANDVLGLSQADRDADPLRLLALVKTAPGALHGFRFFHDHDPRALDTFVDDPRCAKVVLTRNPAESYVSWKIAQATGQWKLTNVNKRKDGKARFEAREFEDHLESLQNFQVQLLNRLQVTGQTAFYVAYEDLQSVDVMNGLARWLGSDHQLETLNKSLKPQNPQSLADKVENFDAMESVLARLDRFNLSRTPNFEPRRGPVVPTYVAGLQAPLLHLPIKSGPETDVENWLAALDGVDTSQLLRDFSQKSLRQWKRSHPGHRSFTVIRHPVARAYAAFCDKILPTDGGGFDRIRKVLTKAHGLALPDDINDPDYDLTKHRAAFAGFLDFVRANLNGQTNLRVDGHWASQSHVLQGMSDFSLPDMIVREDEMGAYLPALAMQVGRMDAPSPVPGAPGWRFDLSDVYDADIESQARAAYQRDYLMFGFGDWAALNG